MELTRPKRKLSWPNTVYLTLTPIGAFVFVPLYLYQSGWQWSMWALFFILSGLTNMAITGGYHRLFAHRSYEARRPLQWLYLLGGASAFQGSALKWATDHRRHHRFVDTEKDPYSINDGFWYAHIGWLYLEDDPRFKDQWAQDLLKDRVIAFQHKFYLPLAIICAFGFPTLLGWALGSAFGGFAVCACLRLVVTNHITFFINSLCHYVGKQPYTDQNSARDSFLMAVLAYGEGYHNFHHKFQTDYRNGIRWYHWDPTKWAIAVMSWLGIAGKLKITPQYQILRARLEMDEKRLVQSGVPIERLKPFRLKIEEAQQKMRQLKADYLVLKHDVQMRSSARVKELKREIRNTRREFKTAWSYWLLVRKNPKLIYSHA